MTLTVVGISYSMRQLSTEAIDVIRAAEVVIGHEHFIEQVNDLLDENTRAFDVLDEIRSGETFLTARVRRADEERRKGARVVILSSGDPGVFGMGGAVLRHMAALEGDNVADEVRIIPGMSAYQIAAAAVGSPLNGGFATIALCLDSQPENVVNRQIEGIAASGLPCVVYMPRHNAEHYPELYPGFSDPVGYSRARLSHLVKVINRDRSGSTPVVLATRVGDADERITRFPLDETMDHFEEITAESILIVCDSTSLEFGSRIVMPTW